MQGFETRTACTTGALTLKLFWNIVEYIAMVGWCNPRTMSFLSALDDLTKVTWHSLVPGSDGAHTPTNQPPQKKQSTMLTIYIYIYWIMSVYEYLFVCVIWICNCVYMYSMCWWTCVNYLTLSMVNEYTLAVPLINLRQYKNTQRIWYSTSFSIVFFWPFHFFTKEIYRNMLHAVLLASVLGISFPPILLECCWVVPC